MARRRFQKGRSSSRRGKKTKKSTWRPKRKTITTHHEAKRASVPAPPPTDSPFGPGMLDFINLQMVIADELYPGQGFMPSADQDYGYMGPQIDASIDPAVDYAERFGLQNILGYPQVEGGCNFFLGGAFPD